MQEVYGQRTSVVSGPEAQALRWEAGESTGAVLGAPCAKALTPRSSDAPVSRARRVPGDWAGRVAQTALAAVGRVVHVQESSSRAGQAVGEEPRCWAGEAARQAVWVAPQRWVEAEQAQAD